MPDSVFFEKSGVKTLNFSVKKIQITTFVLTSDFLIVNEYKKKVKTLVGIKKINYLCTDKITTKLTTKPYLP